MKPNFNWDGQNVGPRRMRDPFSIGALLLNIVPSLSFGIAGALGIGITTLATGVGYLVLAGAAVALSAFGRKQPASAKPSDVQSNIRQEISNRRRVYGRTLMGSVIVFGFRRGEKSYLLHYICEGPIEGFVSFRLDKKPVTLDEDGFVQEDQYIVKGRSRVQILTKLGTMSDGPFAELIAAFPELNTPLTPFRHRGCAMVLQIVEQVPQKYLQETYPNNMPSLQVVIDGANQIYDPRTGAQTFSDNGALCLLNETMDVYGNTPANADDIDFDAFADFADYCDAGVALKAGGTEKRWRCAGPIDLSAENEARIQAIASICNADVFVDRMGRISVRPKLRQTPGIALRAKNGDFLAVGLDGGRPLLKRSNTAKITYVEPSLNYKANELRWRDAALFEEDGTEYILPVTATFCPSPTQAQRLGKLALAEANPEFIGSLTSGPQALDLMEDYVFTLDLSPEENFERVACATDVIEYDQQAMTVSTSFMIFRDGADSWNAAVDEQEEVVVPPELPANVDDVTLEVTAMVELQNNSAPILKFSWVAAGASVLPDSYAQEMEVSPADAEDWAAANVNQDDETAVFGPVADGGAYDWRIRNRAGGKTFDWQVSSSPVTVVVDTVAPLGLLSFSASDGAGQFTTNFGTRNDSHLATVAVYRVPTGGSLDPSVHEVGRYAVAPGISYALPMTSTAGSFDIYVRPFNISSIAGPLSGPDAATVS